jgi:hypothetical protein
MARLLHELILEQATRHPDAIAIVQRQTRLKLRLFPDNGS